MSLATSVINCRFQLGSYTDQRTDPALGIVSAPVGPTTVTDSPAVPTPRRKAAGSGKKTSKKSVGRPARKKAEEPAARKEAPAAASADQPTLVDLVRRHLAEQSEPRSAAEITTALGQAHPERPVKTTVVRSTLEGLVAKSQAERTTQGRSVYYTVIQAASPDASEPQGDAQSG
ncbi:hypothetical protein ACPCTH_33170 [Streptomyces cellulosae]